jgi:hypothetical protein
MNKEEVVIICAFVGLHVFNATSSLPACHFESQHKRIYRVFFKLELSAFSVPLYSN